MHIKHNTRQCVCCLNDLDFYTNLFQLFYQPSVCTNCINQLEIIEKDTVLYGYDLKILYKYNDFIAKLLYQYKNQYDMALSTVFLSVYLSDFSKRYYNHIIIYISNRNLENISGFNSNYQIIEGIEPLDALPFYTDKQNNDITYAKINNQKVLIFDDCIHSDNSLKEAIDLVQMHNPQCIELLVLSFIQKIS